MHSDDASATKTLTDAGFRNILIEGYSYLGCSDEPYHTKFTATNYNGIVVHGIVCGGPFKYNTIRFNWTFRFNQLNQLNQLKFSKITLDFLV